MQTTFDSCHVDCIVCDWFETKCVRQFRARSMLFACVHKMTPVSPRCTMHIQYSSGFCVVLCECVCCHMPFVHTRKEKKRKKLSSADHNSARILILFAIRIMAACRNAQIRLPIARKDYWFFTLSADRFHKQKMPLNCYACKARSHTFCIRPYRMPVRKRLRCQSERGGEQRWKKWYQLKIREAFCDY